MEESAKKARLELSDGHLEQKTGARVGAGRGDLAAVAEHGSWAEVELAVQIDMRRLHCPLCFLPLKPPVFQCKSGHLACDGCVPRGGQCGMCEDGAGFFEPSPAVDAIVSSTKIQCPHDGCQTYVTYHAAADHRSACPHAPCRCTEPGCGGFVGDPLALAGHLAGLHSVPVRTVQYGQASRLQVPVSSGPQQQRLLLLSEDDGRAFLLAVGALGADVTAVSVVCVRAGGAATHPRFSCEMWVDLEPAAAANSGMADTFWVEIQLRSSTTPGAVVAVDEPSFLAVPPMYLVPGEEDGDTAAASMQVPLNIRIHKLNH